MELGDRETNILLNGDVNAVIYTSDRVMMRRLQRNPLATVLDTHRDPSGRVTGMEFEVPKRAIGIKMRLPRRGGPVSPARAAALEKHAFRRGKLTDFGHPGEGQEAV